MTGASDVPEAIRRYFHGVNNEDWDDFRTLWHEDAELEVVGGISLRGLDEVLPYYPSVLRNFPVHHDDPHGIHVAGDTVTVEIGFRGETADGVPAEWEAVDVFTLEDGRIRRLTTWYDIGLVVELLRRPGPAAQRLRRLVRHAAENSPFYRRRFEELGLDPERVAAELALLPPTRYREDFVAAPRDFVAVPDREIRQILTTSGTLSGAPQPVPLTRGDQDDFARLWARALELAGVTPDDVLLALYPHPALADAVARARARLVPMTHATLGLDQQVRAAESLGVTVLAASPSLFLTFRARAAELGADISALRLVLLGGEPWSAALQRLLEQESGCRFVDVYGLTESGVVASACPQGDGMHVYSDAHVVEILDLETGEPVSRGEPGELVVTPLGRRGLPLLRYATGDVTAWSDGPCACGSGLPRITRIRGRVDHRVVVDGVPLFPADVEAVVHEVVGIGAEWQLVVPREGPVRVRVEGDAEAVRARLGLAAVEVERAPDGALPREHRFKAQRLVRE